MGEEKLSKQRIEFAEAEMCQDTIKSLGTANCSVYLGHRVTMDEEGREKNSLCNFNLEIHTLWAIYFVVKYILKGANHLEESFTGFLTG